MNFSHQVSSVGAGIKSTRTRRAVLSISNSLHLPERVDSLQMQAPEHLSSDANHSEKAGRDRSELVSLDGGVSDQISLENGHAVRYRTCSWQKVSPASETAFFHFYQRS